MAVGLRNFPDIAGHWMTIQGKVFGIGLLGIQVPLACEYALASGRFEAQAHSTYAGKEINEAKRRWRVVVRRRFVNAIPKM
jgi:hypothetical protein